MTTPTTGARILGAACLLMASSLAACEIEFDDETKAIVKKPELLSVVLDPPEVAPGAKVKASFLMADEKGVYTPALSLWMPQNPQAAGFSDLTGMAGLLKKLGITVADLSRSTLTFNAKPKQGLAQHPLYLVVAIAPLPSNLNTPDRLMTDLEGAMNKGLVKLSTRTLVVSTRKARAPNPAVDAITATVGADAGTSPETPLTLCRHDEVYLKAARQLAADQPLSVEEDQEVFFTATRVPDATKDEDIRYQWISTGGDFGGTRKRVQRWVAPAHRIPGAGEKDQTGLTNVDPRKDPNLYPVWLILRNTGAADRFGQSWTELYVRIKRASKP